MDVHVWRHTRRGDKYVTVIIDLAGIREGTGPARLLDLVEGRSKQAFKTWLSERPKAWPDAVEVVAMDGFTGFKTATTEGLPDAVAVMDPLHVVRLAGDALDRCRRRVQQTLHGHRGRKDDRSTGSGEPCTPAAPTSSPTKQCQRLKTLFESDDHAQVEATWGIHQRMIAAYREPDRTRGRDLMSKLIASVSHEVSAAHPRLPQPHQLHRQITARDRRLQTPTTPRIVRAPSVADRVEDTKRHPGRPLGRDRHLLDADCVREGELWPPISQAR